MRALTRTECCTLLGIEPRAPEAAIKEAYRDMVKVWHPDRFPAGSRLQQKAAEKMKEINRAYDTVKSGLFGAEETLRPRPQPQPQPATAPENRTKPPRAPRPKTAPRPDSNRTHARQETPKREPATPSGNFASRRQFPKWYALACVACAAGSFEFCTSVLLTEAGQACLTFFTVFGGLMGLTAFAYAHARKLDQLVTFGSLGRGYWAGVVDCGWGLGKVAKVVGVVLCVLFVALLAVSAAQAATSASEGKTSGA